MKFRPPSKEEAREAIGSLHGVCLNMSATHFSLEGISSRFRCPPK
jgi:hypothetical protein